MENLYTGQGVGIEEDGDDDEDEVDGNVSRLVLKKGQLMRWGCVSFRAGSSSSGGDHAFFNRECSFLLRRRKYVETIPSW